MRWIVVLTFRCPWIRNLVLFRGGHASFVRLLVRWRHVSWVERRIWTGNGFSQEQDKQLYEQLVDRVEQRATKRVIIGAAPDRLHCLSDGLSAVGYSAAGASDPSSLARLTTMPADMAIVDASLIRGVGNSWIRRVFTSRNIPCISTNQDSVERTRANVDTLLRVTG